MPVLGVWVDGALSFSAGEASRKGKNLAGVNMLRHVGDITIPC